MAGPGGVWTVDVTLAGVTATLRAASPIPLMAYEAAPGDWVSVLPLASAWFTATTNVHAVLAWAATVVLPDAGAIAVVPVGATSAAGSPGSWAGVSDELVNVRV